MSNTGRYTLCPFYEHDKRLTITCEDTFRRWDSRKDKARWMDTYCDDAWKTCPYAISLLQMYDRIERGDNMAEAQHKIEALDAELRKMSIKLGMAERKIDDRDKEIRRLKHELSAARDQSMVMLARMQTTAEAYEGRFAYLMTEYGPGTFSEEAFRKWSAGKEFRIEGTDPGEDGKPTVWKATVREVEVKKSEKE